MISVCLGQQWLSASLNIIDIARRDMNIAYHKTTYNTSYLRDTLLDHQETLVKEQDEGRF